MEELLYLKNFLEPYLIILLDIVNKEKTMIINAKKIPTRPHKLKDVKNEKVINKILTPKNAKQ